MIKFEIVRDIVYYFLVWNISGVKSTSPCNRANSNLDHRIDIQGGAEGVGGGICKNVITQSKGGQLIVKLPNLLIPLC